MTKTFENDLNEKLNSEKVPMYITQNGCSLTRKTFIETNWLFENYGNYHSDEEFHELSEKLDALVIAQNSRDEFEREYKKLKSQLQQQSLPVVPECVGKELKRLESTSMTTIGRIRFWTGDTVYDLDDEVAEWVGDNEETILRAMLYGYTVEKPQLFYLKHIDMSKADKECDYFAQIRNDRFEHESVQNNTLPGVEVVGVRFTQAEIDSMQIGSYEQIEVAE